MFTHSQSSSSIFRVLFQPSRNYDAEFSDNDDAKKLHAERERVCVSVPLKCFKLTMF